MSDKQVCACMQNFFLVLPNAIKVGWEASRSSSATRSIVLLGSLIFDI
ncbi:hypothetical protein Pint_01060 [Pistacia integerrima]|uniref:Uncharacterized protein n=1 Tax=Pistacia integerrima TaxID=434235 RepID=A0ACC0ZLA8_9ROSI|nr:hypothetical protein Pint_01060 [Pistacia integerrima]